MLRSHNNANNYLEKQREHLVRSRVKKYPPLQPLDYLLEHTHFVQIGQSKLSGRKSVWNHPNTMGDFLAFKSESILPEKRLPFVRKML
jgi:hypothetical protein